MTADLKYKTPLAALVFTGLLALGHTNTASALAIDPLFAGHQVATLGDDDSVLVPIGFNYGTPYYFTFSNLYINSNGNITFSDPYPNSSPDLPTFMNGSLGSCCELEMFAPLWTDLNPGVGGQITYGNPTPDTFAVSWVNVPHYADPLVTNTAQLILFADSYHNPGLALGTYSTNTGIAIQPSSALFAYDLNDLNLTVDTPAAIGRAASYGGYLETLNPLGIGDIGGNVTAADVAALRASDPYLFNGQYNSQPIAFSYVVGLSTPPVPEPETYALLLAGLGLISLTRRRKQ